MNIALQIVGVALIVVFLWIAWPPLLLLAAGLALVAGVEAADR